MRLHLTEHPGNDVPVLRFERYWWTGCVAVIAAVRPAGYILLINYTNGTDKVTLHGGQPAEEWTALATDVTDGQRGRDGAEKV